MHGSCSRSPFSLLLQTWTEKTVQWSPKGHYLATFHQQGIVLWGGHQFQKLYRFPHAGVAHAEFSPCEKYLLTCNLRDSNNKADHECFVVWDVRSQKKLRGFDG